MPPTSSVVMPPGRQSRSSSAASSDHPCGGGAWPISIFNVRFGTSRTLLKSVDGRNTSRPAMSQERRRQYLPCPVAALRTTPTCPKILSANMEATSGAGATCPSRTIAISLGFPPHAPDSDWESDIFSSQPLPEGRDIAASFVYMPPPPASATPPNLRTDDAAPTASTTPPLSQLVGDIYIPPPAIPA